MPVFGAHHEQLLGAASDLLNSLDVTPTAPATLDSFSTIGSSSSSTLHKTGSAIWDMSRQPRCRGPGRDKRFTSFTTTNNAQQPLGNGQLINGQQQLNNNGQNNYGNQQNNNNLQNNNIQQLNNQNNQNGNNQNGNQSNSGGIFQGASASQSDCKPSAWKVEHMGQMMMGPLGFVFGILFYVAFCRKEDDDDTDSD